MKPITVTASIEFHDALNAVCRAVDNSTDPGFEFAMGDADRLESAARDIRHSITAREARLKSAAEAQYDYEQSGRNETG